MNMDNSLNGRMPLFKDEFCVWSPAGKAALEYDVNGEYVLPDYLPDVRKVLAVRTRLSEDAESVTDGRAEYSGDVIFTVVYLSEDGRVKSIRQSYPYTNFIALESIYEDSVINAEQRITNRSVRAVSPRKLILKAKVLTEVEIFNRLCVSPRLVGGSGVEDEFAVERMTDSVGCVSFIPLTESDIRVSSDVEYKGRMPISEIVCSDVSLFLTECRCSDGRISLKGNARLWALVECADADGKVLYDSVEANLPIEHTIQHGGINSENQCVGKLKLNELECGLGADAYGENRLLQVDFACAAELLAAANEETVFTSDAFSTVYEYENAFKTVDTERVAKMGISNFSVDGNAELPAAEGISYVKVTASAFECNMALESLADGKAVFGGECNVRLVVSDEKGGLHTVDSVLPLRFEAKADSVDNGRATMDCRVIDSSFSLDGSRVNVNLEIGVSYGVFERISVETVSAITLDKGRERSVVPDGSMILYYPDAKETLWSIAKKYGVTRSALEKANGDPDDNNLPRVLLIPLKAK